MSLDNSSLEDMSSTQEGAIVLHELFTSYVDAGFKWYEACFIIASLMHLDNNNMSEEE